MTDEMLAMFEDAKRTRSIGGDRERYDRDVEPRPSRFSDPEAYAAWAARADAWAEVAA